MIVLDASAMIEVLLNTPAGGRIAQRVLADEETIHAPHLLDLEVTQVLRRYVIGKELSGVRAREAMDDFLDIRIFRYPHEPFLNRIWDLRSVMTAYDAAYVALAEGLEVPLVTQDLKLAAAAGKLVHVESH